MKLAIYGAQGYALGVYEAVKTLYPDRKIMGFLVTEIGYNAKKLGGLPVMKIQPFADGLSDADKNNIQVLIATPENVQDEIEETLERYGFHDRLRMTSEIWDELMRQLNAKTGQFQSLRDLTAGKKKAALYVYFAKSHKDRQLINEVVLPKYMHPVQVGATNTDERICEIQDDHGENISAKNGNYSELTGLYWLWKNVLCDSTLDGDAKEAYYGFAQYRRMLILPDEDIYKLGNNKVDVVLPYPLPYEPDINMHHDRYLKEADWNAMLTALRELQPEYANALEVFLHQKYLYNYNVILARREILCDYCEWLFPILERIEELSTPKGGERADRYIGYMGETLETLYFMKNSDKLRIVHTGCKLLV